MTGREAVTGGGIRDSERFAGLIRDHAGIVRKVAASYARNPHDRADLMQEILANLWASWSRYDDARPFPTWMYRVALDVALSHVRSVYRERSIARGVIVAAASHAFAKETEAWLSSWQRY